MKRFFKTALVAAVVAAGLPNCLEASPSLRVRMNLYQLIDNEDAYLPAGTDFHNVKPGTVRFSYFILENTGNSTLNFVAPPVLLGDNANLFSVATPPPASIPASGSATMVIRYQPNGPGEHEASLSVTTDDPQPLFTINFTGQCVPIEQEGTPTDLALIDFIKPKQKCHPVKQCKLSGKAVVSNLSLVEAMESYFYLWPLDSNGFTNKLMFTFGESSMKKIKARKSFADPAVLKKAKVKMLKPLPQLNSYALFVYPANGDVQVKDNFLSVEFPH